MKGTYVERDRKKEKKKPKPEPGISKKAAAAMVAGVPAAMPVSGALIYTHLLMQKQRGCILNWLPSVGNASYEPGSTDDAHSRSAAVHAPSRHDAPTWNGPRPDAPRGPCSWSDDAWTDAPAGSVSECSSVKAVLLSLTGRVDMMIFSRRFQKIPPITSSSSQTCQRRRTSSCSPCCSTSEYQLCLFI